MKTTIEIPDELFRQVKARAAMDGVRLKDIVEQGLQLALKSRPKAVSTRVQFPLIRSKHPGTLTSEDVRKAEAEVWQEEDARNGGVGRR